MKIKAIVFDFDDTLLRTSESKYAALKHAGKKFYDIKLTDDDIKKHWGKPFTVFIEHLYRGVEETQKIIEKYYSVRDMFPNTADKEVNEVLKKLSKITLLGILSATARKQVLGDIAIAGLELNHFFYIQTEEDTKIHKPDPKVFVPMLKKLKGKNIRNGETVYVGDSIFDFYAAKGAGLEFLGLADRTTPKTRFLQEGARTITSFKELLLLDLHETTE